MASEQIVYNIIARDQASKKFKDVGDASEKAGSRISGGFSKIGLLAGGAATAIGGLGAAGAIMGIKTAASLEQAQIGFTTMLGSAQKAGAYVKDLQKFAAATPFEFSGLVDSSRLLLGVGVSANKVIPMLTDFGDAAGALGIQQDAFQRIMLASSQAISAGRFQVGDLNQIVQNGIPVWSLLSKSLGKPVTALRKMASQGKLTSDIVLPALQRQMHKDYGGSMAKQSQTLAGLWSTFTDTLSQGLAQAMLPLVPMLKSILPGAMNFMGIALQGLASGLKFVITGVQGIIAGFRSGQGAAGGLGTAVKGLASWFTGELMPAVATMYKSLAPGLIAAFKSIGTTISNNRATFAQLGAILTGVVIPAVGLIARTVLPAVSLAFKLFMLNLKTIILPGVKLTIQSIVTVIGWIVTAAAAAFGWIPGIGGKLKSAKRAFDIFANGVNNALNGIHDKKVNVKVVASINGSKLTNQAKSKALDIAFRASGGPVRAGSPYVVGEEGPELFVPGQSGGIVPNGKSARNGAGGGTTINLYVSGATDAMAAGKQIVGILQKYTQATGPLQVKVKSA